MAIVEDVYAALETVEDPEMLIGIVPLGLVYGVSVSGDDNNEVEVRMTFTSPMCPVAPMIKQNVQDAIDVVPGIAKATIEITGRAVKPRRLGRGYKALDAQRPQDQCQAYGIVTR